MTGARGSCPQMPSRTPAPSPRHPMRSHFAHLVLASALLAGSSLSAQQPTPKYDRNAYEHTSADIPMRDGLKLHVEIFAPRNATEPLPFLFERTPYGVAEMGERLKEGYSDLADEGYIF